MSPDDRSAREANPGRQNIPDDLHPAWGKGGGDRADQPPRQQPEFSPSDPDIAGVGEGNRPA